MYEIRLGTDIDWDTEEAIAIIIDHEFDYVTKKRYRIDMEILESKGVEYLDDLFAYIINEATKEMITNRRELRKEIKNVYEDTIDGKKTV